MYIVHITCDYTKLSNLAPNVERNLIFLTLDVHGHECHLLKVSLSHFLPATRPCLSRWAASLRGSPVISCCSAGQLSCLHGNTHHQIFTRSPPYHTVSIPQTSLPLSLSLLPHTQTTLLCHAYNCLHVHVCGVRRHFLSSFQYVPSNIPFPAVHRYIPLIFYFWYYQTYILPLFTAYF